MPRKSLDELDNPAPAPSHDAEVVVPASEVGTTKKVKLDLEVDTSVKDLGPNPYAKVIHLARAVDAWRIFPRLFLTVYIILLYKTVIWQNLETKQVALAQHKFNILRSVKDAMYDE